MNDDYDWRRFDAASTNASLGSSLRCMWRDLKAARGLAWLLFQREIRTQYRQSLLGLFWAMVPPLVTALAMVMASKGRVVDLGPVPMPLPLYVALGVVLWQSFAEAVLGPATAVGKNKSLLVRVLFPRESLILAKMLEVAFGFGIRLLLVAGLMIYFGIVPGPSALLIPVLLCILIICGTAIGALFAPLSLVTDDVQRGMGIAMMIGMFVTPVFYSPHAGSRVAEWMAMNPAAPIIGTGREILLGMPLSDPTPFFVVGAASILALLVTWWSFRIAVPYALERLN